MVTNIIKGCEQFVSCIKILRELNISCLKIDAEEELAKYRKNQCENKVKAKTCIPGINLNDKTVRDLFNLIQNKGNNSHGKCITLIFLIYMIFILMMMMIKKK